MFSFIPSKAKFIADSSSLNKTNGSPCWLLYSFNIAETIRPPLLEKVTFTNSFSNVVYSSVPSLAPKNNEVESSVSFCWLNAAASASNLAASCWAIAWMES